MWNWQQPDWPDFSWNSSLLDQAEAHFLRDSGGFVGSIKHLDAEDRDVIMIEAISNESLTTSAIEGELLNRASVQSSIRKQLGLKGARLSAKPSEEGIAEMMVNLYRSFAEPLTDETLFSWHTMVMKGRNDLNEVGCYRTSKEPMQIVSGAIYKPRVHFEAPPSKAIPAQMRKFLKWFRRTAPGGPEALPLLTRAGIAHLYFISIHPFKDGNGRIGRAIAAKALAQGLGQPSLIALSGTMLTHRKKYYSELEAASKHNEITRWLTWFAKIALEAQLRTTAQVDFVIHKTHLLRRLQGQLNERQEKALLRMFREGIEGFQGGLSAKNYTTITKASTATTTRDLADLVAKGALTRTGELRHARYHLAIQ